MERRKIGHERRHDRLLKITLDDVRPAVLRRVEVPFDIPLDRLHLIIQAAMGWTNSHLYELRAGGVGWSTPDPNDDWSDDVLDARKARLGEVLRDVGGKKLTLTSPILATAGSTRSGSSASPKRKRGVPYPRMIEVRGRCPPEDCGGPWGYADLLEGSRPSRTQTTIVEWIGDDFDPGDDNAEWLAAEVAALVPKEARQQTPLTAACAPEGAAV